MVRLGQITILNKYITQILSKHDFMYFCVNVRFKITHMKICHFFSCGLQLQHAKFMLTARGLGITEKYFTSVS